MPKITLYRYNVPIAEATVSECDFEFLNQFKWYLSDNGYAATSNTAVTDKIYMHRMIMGTTLEGRKVAVDHIDRNKLNNTQENLRVVSYHVNSLNRKSVGVEKLTDSNRAKPYRARVKLHGKTKTLGCFASMEEALAHRSEFIKEYLQ